MRVLPGPCGVGWAFGGPAVSGVFCGTSVGVGVGVGVGVRNPGGGPEAISVFPGLPPVGPEAPGLAGVGVKDVCALEPGVGTCAPIFGLAWRRRLSGLAVAGCGTVTAGVVLAGAARGFERGARLRGLRGGETLETGATDGTLGTAGRRRGEPTAGGAPIDGGAPTAGGAAMDGGDTEGASTVGADIVGGAAIFGAAPTVGGAASVGGRLSGLPIAGGATTGGATTGGATEGTRLRGETGGASLGEAPASAGGWARLPAARSDAPDITKLHVRAYSPAGGCVCWMHAASNCRGSALALVTPAANRCRRFCWIAPAARGVWLSARASSGSGSCPSSERIKPSRSRGSSFERNVSTILIERAWPG